jgi:hypothetical protein
LIKLDHFAISKFHNKYFNLLMEPWNPILEFVINVSVFSSKPHYQ